MIKNRKKIGIVVNSLNYGGNERSAMNIANALQNHFIVHIIVQELINPTLFSGTIINMGLKPRKSFFAKIINGIRRLRKLKKIIRKEKYDAVLIILPITNIINYFRFGCKKIVSCRDCGDLIKHPNSYKNMAIKSDTIVFNSKYQEDFFTNRFPSLRSKCKTIYNIVDFKKIDTLKLEPIEKDFPFFNNKKNIVAVGRLAYAKGFGNLIKSFYLVKKKEREATLTIIGDGLLKPKLNRLIEETHLENSVALLGYSSNPFKYIYNSAVFVLSSYYEGFPNVLIEALACDANVVSTNCPSGPFEILNTSGKSIKTDDYTICECGIISPTFESKNEWDSTYFENAHIVFANAIITSLNFEKNKLSRLRSLDFDETAIADEWRTLFEHRNSN